MQPVHGPHRPSGPTVDLPATASTLSEHPPAPAYEERNPASEFQLDVAPVSFIEDQRSLFVDVALIEEIEVIPVANESPGKPRADVDTRLDHQLQIACLSDVYSVFIVEIIHVSDDQSEFSGRPNGPFDR